MHYLHMQALLMKLSPLSLLAFMGALFEKRSLGHPPLSGFGDNFPYLPRSSSFLYKKDSGR